MPQFRITSLVALVAAGMVGCSHCDTCDDFPMPLGSYGGANGAAPYAPLSYAPQGGGPAVGGPAATTQLGAGASSQLPPGASSQFPAGIGSAPASGPIQDTVAPNSTPTPPPLPESGDAKEKAGAASPISEEKPQLVPNN